VAGFPVTDAEAMKLVVAESVEGEKWPEGKNWAKSWVEHDLVNPAPKSESEKLQDDLEPLPEDDIPF